MSLLQVCPNGPCTRAERQRPVTPADLPAIARSAITACARDIHLHPKTPGGLDWLADIVGAALATVRSAVPGVIIGVTTGS